MKDSESKSSLRERGRAHNLKCKQKLEERFARRKLDPEDLKIEETSQFPEPIDMEALNGTMADLDDAIECFYSKNGGDFDPHRRDETPTWIFNHVGKDWALNARGIYYRDRRSKAPLETSQIWIPSLDISNDGSPEALEQRQRAQNLARRARNNETCVKSEYTWEADAWADVFPRMRDDPCLELDKHEYKALVADTDRCFSNLTGTSTMVCRTPDATFGLATFSDQDAHDPLWNHDLHRDRLERLMLHPKYGLVSDPKITSTSLSFPFMVYEAKGWRGDCREARRQATSAAAAYLDLLDNLVRRPGQVDSPRPYQTTTSNKYQVFALTSFGAYWHVLVGHRRARSEIEHAGPEMSDSVYIFQRVWSGRITSEKNARQLLSIVDQIHNWAITEFRSFILEHLRPWHRLCDENYLLEWDSKYPVSSHRKRKRDCEGSTDLMVPKWVAEMPSAVRRDFQKRAKSSLDEALQAANLPNSKFHRQHKEQCTLTCFTESYGLHFDSMLECQHHLRTVHGYADRELAQSRWSFHEDEMKWGPRQKTEHATQHGECRYLSQIGPAAKKDIFVASST